MEASNKSPVKKKNPRSKRIKKNFFIGAGGAGISALIRFALISIVTNQLSIFEFGKFQIVVTVTNLILMFLDLKTEFVVYKFMTKFKEENEVEKVRGLFWLAVGLTAMVGGTATLGTFFFAENIAGWYQDPQLALLLQLYSIVLLFSAFSHISAAVLRLHNRFIWVAGPALAGNMLTLALVGGTVLSGNRLTLELVVIFEAAGLVFGDFPALVISYRALKYAGISIKTVFSDVAALSSNRAAIQTVLFQGNLTGYLKIGSERGGMFLLSLLGSPAEVAYMAIGRSLMKPMQLVYRNLSTAVAPEIHKMYTSKNYEGLERILKQFHRYGFLFGASALVLFGLLFPTIVDVFFTESYLGARYSVLMQFAISILAIALGPIFQLAVAMNKLAERLKLMTFSLVVVSCAVFLHPTANMLAGSLLMMAIVSRFTVDFMVQKALRQEIKLARGSDNPA